MEITHFVVKTRMLVNRDGTEKEPRQKICSHYNVRIDLIKGIILRVMSERKTQWPDWCSGALFTK